MVNSYFLTDLSFQQQQLVEAAGLRLTPYGVDDRAGFVVPAQEIEWSLTCWE